MNGRDLGAAVSDMLTLLLIWGVAIGVAIGLLISFAIYLIL